MRFKHETNKYTFVVEEASLFSEFAKDKYHKDHADEYLIIFNITDPQNRMNNKTSTNPTNMFMQKRHLIEGYEFYLMHDLDFDDEYVANEFRKTYNFQLNRHRVLGLP